MEGGNQKHGLQGDFSVLGPWKEEFSGFLPRKVAEGFGKWRWDEPKEVDGGQSICI